MPMIDGQELEAMATKLEAMAEKYLDAAETLRHLLAAQQLSPQTENTQEETDEEEDGEVEESEQPTSSNGKKHKPPAPPTPERLTPQQKDLMHILKDKTAGLELKSIDKLMAPLGWTKKGSIRFSLNQLRRAGFVASLGHGRHILVEYLQPGQTADVQAN